MRSLIRKKYRLLFYANLKVNSASGVIGWDPAFHLINPVRYLKHDSSVLDTEVQG